MKDIIYRILREKGLLISDAEDIFSAMGEILFEAAKQTELHEPYATESIALLERFSVMVDGFDSFVESHSY